MFQHPTVGAMLVHAHVSLGGEMFRTGLGRVLRNICSSFGGRTERSSLMFVKS